METRSEERIEERKEPVGGYEPISVFQMASVWWAYREGSIRKLDLRVWWALWELEVRRRLSGGKHRPDLDDLGRLVGSKPGQGGLSSSLERLARVGLIRLSKEGASFARFAEGLVLRDPSGFEEMLGDLPSPRRVVPVPRRMIRRLAGGLSKARTAVVIAHLIRCLFHRRGEGCSASGSAKASWIASAFGLTERSVYDARSYLVSELGWLIPRECSQRTLNRNGLRVTVNLAWGPEERSRTEAAPAEIESSGLPADSPAGFSGPIENKTPPPSQEEHKDQKPAGRGPTGVSSPEGEEERTPDLRNITPPDLKETTRLLALYDQAVARGLVSGSEADRLKFVSAAVHAGAVGSDPPRLFAWMLRERRWSYITQADEDEAHARIKRRLNPPIEQGRCPIGQPFLKTAAPPRRVLSEDAMLVEHLTNELRRRGINRDVYYVVKPHLPADWTRERWDRASLELQPGGLRATLASGSNPADSGEKRS